MEENKKNPSKLSNLIFENHFKITIRVIIITVSVIAILAGGGYMLDQKLGTDPLLMITGLIIGFPLAQYIIYKNMKKLTEKTLNSK